MSNEKLRSAALALPPEERAELAHELLVSLHEDEPSPHVGAAWIDELDRRAKAVTNGTAKLVDWEEARARIAIRLKERREARRPR